MIQFSRQWAMPSADTFDIPPIKEFVKKYLRDSKVSIDPFARNKRWATYTNDLNPETEAEFHMDAVEFLLTLKERGVVADTIILDPPYSMHQVTKTYSGYGDKRVNALTPIYDASTELLATDGVVLSFGFNTNGIARDGYKIEEILLVPHGGHHNDTICMAERKMAHQLELAV